MAATQLSKDLLRARFVGKTLHNVPTPAAVLDLAKVEANCNQMLRTARRLNLNWRAHIKTHKVSQPEIHTHKHIYIRVYIYT